MPYKVKRIDCLIEVKVIPEDFCPFYLDRCGGERTRRVERLIAMTNWEVVRAIRFEFNEMNVVSRLLNDFYELLE